MLKNIAVRGKKDIVAVFNKYAQISGKQDTGRPQATLEFINYIAGLPLNDETATELKAASRQRIDESGIADSAVPVSIKIPVAVEDIKWNKAMDVFKFVFKLQGNPQMPYFLRVSGMAYIKMLEEQNAELDVVGVKAEEASCIETMGIAEFRELSTDDKLVELFRLLRERGV